MRRSSRLFLKAAFLLTMNATLSAAETEAAASPSPTPITKGQRVFTAGHSFHAWVAPILEEMAKAAGYSDHQVAGVSSIGATQVIDHWLSGDDNGNNKIKRAIVAGQVDVLTVSPIYLPDQGIRQFAFLGAKSSPDFRMTVLELWVPNDEYVPHFPYKHKKYEQNETVIATLRDSQTRYDNDMDAYIEPINKKLGRTVVVTVPAGQAVATLREKVVAGEVPGIKKQQELFADSWGHPKELIKALAAYCHYAVIYRRSPVGLPVPQVLKESNLPPETLEPINKLLQEIAWETVVNHPASGVPKS